MNDDANLLIALVQRYWAWIGGTAASIYGLGKAAQRFSAMEAKIKKMGEQIEAVQAKHEADNDALASRIEQQTEKTLERLDATNKVLADVTLGLATVTAKMEVLLDAPAPRPRRRTTQD